VAQNGARTASEHGSQINTFQINTPRTHRIDPWVEAMKSPYCKAVADARICDPGFQELAPCRHRVLAFCQLGDLHIEMQNVAPGRGAMDFCRSTAVMTDNVEAWRWRCQPCVIYGAAL
jgi:hypothetical protein